MICVIKGRICWSNYGYILSILCLIYRAFLQVGCANSKAEKRGHNLQSFNFEIIWSNFWWNATLKAKEEQPLNKSEIEISSGTVEDAKQIEDPNIFSSEEEEEVEYV